MSPLKLATLRTIVSVVFGLCVFGLLRLADHVGLGLPAMAIVLLAVIFITHYGKLSSGERS